MQDLRWMVQRLYQAFLVIHGDHEESCKGVVAFSQKYHLFDDESAKVLDDNNLFYRFCGEVKRREESIDVLSLHPLFAFTHNLDRESRLVLIGLYVFGIDKDVMKDALGLVKSAFDDKVIAVHKSMSKISKKQDVVSDVFYLYVHDWDHHGFNRTLKAELEDQEGSEALQVARMNFQEGLGQWQMALSRARIVGADLRQIFVSSGIKESDIMLQETKSLWRASIIQFLMIGVFFCISLSGLFYLFYERRSEKLDVLQVTGYESLAMMRATTTERLYFLSGSLEEIEDYFKQAVKHDTFQPVVLIHLGSNWSLEGASVIDYNFAELAVVQYRHQETEPLFLFSMKGTQDDLPITDKIDAKGQFFHPYASDKINLISWQHDERTLAILAGRLKIADLVKVAQNR